MSEWWTYSLSSFLLFSARTYYRLFELYNADVWPLQIVGLTLGLVILVLIWRAPVWSGRAVATILVACWLFVAWAYLLERYDSINWIARYFAIGFAMQAALLIWTGIIRDRLRFDLGGISGRFGLTILLYVLVMYPLIPWLAGRPWTQAEIFGLAPDPTAIATLGILLATDRPRWRLLVLPLLWCMISGLTLWTMEQPEAPVSAIVVASVLITALKRSRLW